MIRRPTNKENEEIKGFLSTNGVLLYMQLFGILFFITIILCIIFSNVGKSLKGNFFAYGLIAIMLINFTNFAIKSLKPIIKYRKTKNEIKNLNYHVIDCIMTDIKLESIRSRKSDSIRYIIKLNICPTDDIYLYSAEQQKLFNKTYELKTFYSKFQLYQDFYHNKKPTNCILIILPNNESFVFYPQKEYIQ